jgi:hypothetical protein
MAKMIGGNIDYSVAQSSLTALEICEASYISSRYQCKVAFPFDKFSIPDDREKWEMGIPYSGTGGGRDGRKLV